MTRYEPYLCARSTCQHYIVLPLLIGVAGITRALVDAIILRLHVYALQGVTQPELTTASLVHCGTVIVSAQANVWQSAEC